MLTKHTNDNNETTMCTFIKISRKPLRTFINNYTKKIPTNTTRIYVNKTYKQNNETTMFTFIKLSLTNI